MNKLTEEEKLCTSIQEMGTTFIKLGQFLSTRPDIIGEDLSTQLEKLQEFTGFIPVATKKKTYDDLSMFDPLRLKFGRSLP